MKLNLLIFFSNKEDITEDKLSQARIFVVAGSREKFTAAEVGKFQKLKFHFEWDGVYSDRYLDRA